VGGILTASGIRTMRFAAAAGGAIRSAALPSRVQRASFQMYRVLRYSQLHRAK